MEAFLRTAAYIMLNRTRSGFTLLYILWDEANCFCVITVLQSPLPLFCLEIMQHNRICYAPYRFTEHIGNIPFRVRYTPAGHLFCNPLGHSCGKICSLINCLAFGDVSVCKHPKSFARPNLGYLMPQSQRPLIIFLGFHKSLMSTIRDVTEKLLPMINKSNKN